MSFPNPAEVGRALGDAAKKKANERRLRRALDRDLGARAGDPVVAVRYGDEDDGDEVVERKRRVR